MRSAAHWRIYMSRERARPGGMGGGAVGLEADLIHMEFALAVVVLVQHNAKAHKLQQLGKGVLRPNYLAAQDLPQTLSPWTPYAHNTVNEGGDKRARLLRALKWLLPGHLVVRSHTTRRAAHAHILVVLLVRVVTVGNCQPKPPSCVSRVSGQGQAGTRYALAQALLGWGLCTRMAALAALSA